MSAGHVLVIEPPIAEGHYQRMRIECPGVTDECRSWAECRVEHSKDDVERMWDEAPVHGVRHEHLPYLGWCVPTDRCWLQIVEIADEVSDYGLEPGRYTFTWRAEDDGEYVTFPSITPAEAQS